MAFFIDFRSVLMQWQNIGIFDIILPMLLIFTLIYAILLKSKILGTVKGINAIVSLVIAFLAISNPDISSLFMPIFANLGLGIIIMLAALLLVGLVTGDKQIHGAMWLSWIGIIAIFLWILSRVFYGYSFFYSGWISDNMVWIVPVILIGIVIAVVLSEKPEAGHRSLAERFFEPWPKAQ